MLFNSWEFLWFFPVVFFLYYALPQRFRWPMLLTASCIFYMAYIPKYILILFATIVVDYWAGRLIEKSAGRRRDLWLYVSVVVTCMILFFFKYYDFFAVNVTGLAQLIGWNYSVQSLQLILPIGLSFHTFQSLSYVIEVYRGNQKAEKHFGIYALYVMFFPQMVAGPIERPQNLLHQFHKKMELDYGHLASGAKLIAWGLFKKVVIADRLALFVNPVYHDPVSANYPSLFIAFVFFYFQIYADFSGYSDIARGTARMLGFDLMRNFNLPYLAKSLTDFWKRWHISLSTWLRDYVYEPLALQWRQHSYLGIALALVVTFFVSGLWHGAKWTFVAWGLLHGAILTSEMFAGRFYKVKNRIFPPRYADAIGVVRTFILVSVSYVLFRAVNFHDAFFILHTLAAGFREIPAAIHVMLTGSGNPAWHGAGFAFGLTALMIAVEMLYTNGYISRQMAALPRPARIVAYQAFVLLLVICGTWFGEGQQFIYFQF